MPFGVINGPTYYVIFAFDMNFFWHLLAKDYNVKIGVHNNTRIIIDDTFMFIKTHIH